MVIDDSLAFIPLLLTLAVNAALLVLFVVLKIKRIRISIFQFLAAIVMLLGCFFAVRTSSLFLAAIAALTQGLLLILYCLVFFYKHTAEQDQRAELPARSARRFVPARSGAKEEEIPLDSRIIQAGKDITEVSTDTISEHSEIPYLLDRINDIVVQNTKADGGAILLVDEFEDLVSVKSLIGDFPPPYKLPEDIAPKELAVKTHFKNADFPFEDNIFGSVVKTGNSELILSPQTDSHIAQNTQEDFLQASSYIFVPIKVRDTVIGIIALARKKTSEKFGQEELLTAQILSDFAGIAVRNVYAFQEKSEYAELTREALIAGNLQQTLYLKKIPPLPALSVGSFLNTVEGVCSDYFDIISARSDRISFILADVTGKSMVSLTIMIMIRAIMRVIVNTPQSASTILSWTNRGIALESAIDHYASLALVNYDAAKKEIQFSTAGASPVLYFAAKEKTWKKVSSESEPLGVEKTTKYADHALKLQSGDIIALYTDGLVESVDENGIQYSENRLKEVIGTNASRDGKQIADAVNSDLTGFMGNAAFHDDQSLVVLKIQ